MSVENPQSTIFYIIEQSIKTYRQFAQSRLNAAHLEITLDQALLLRALHDYPDASQSEIGNLIFKDYASVTRMVELLVRKGLLLRTQHAGDRRRSVLRLSSAGKKTLKKLNGILAENRRLAQADISASQMKRLRSTLRQIISNCQNGKL